MAVKVMLAFFLSVSLQSTSVTAFGIDPPDFGGRPHHGKVQNKYGSSFGYGYGGDRPDHQRQQILKTVSNVLRPLATRRMLTLLKLKRQSTTVGADIPSAPLSSAVVSAGLPLL